MFALQAIAVGFGFAGCLVSMKKMIKRIGGDQEIIIEMFWHDEENGGCRESRQRKTIKELAEEWVYDKWMRDHMGEIKTLNQFLSGVRDLYESDWGYCGAIMPVPQFEAYEQEKRRKELELVAGEVAQKHNVKVSSIEFIKAIKQEIELINEDQDQWNSAEVQMEEWAAHRYAGCTDTYFDNKNYVNSDFSSRQSELYDILDWLGESCPLLMAKYNESLQ